VDQLKQCADRCGWRLASVGKFATPCDRDRRAGSVYSRRLGKFGCEVILYCSQLRLTRLFDSRPTVAATYSNRALIFWRGQSRRAPDCPCLVYRRWNCRGTAAVSVAEDFGTGASAAVGFGMAGFYPGSYWGYYPGYYGDGSLATRPYTVRSTVADHDRGAARQTRSVKPRSLDPRSGAPRAHAALGRASQIYAAARLPIESRGGLSIL
jgi:hypothetical protein